MDSGIGLLPAAAAVRRLRPDAELLLSNDPDGMPWGPRTPEDLTGRAKQVLVTTPFGFRRQEIPGMPYETHRSGWYPWEFGQRFRVRRWQVFPGHYTRFFRRPKLFQVLALLEAR